MRFEAQLITSCGRDVPLLVSPLVELVSELIVFWCRQPTIKVIRAQANNTLIWELQQNPCQLFIGSVQGKRFLRQQSVLGYWNYQLHSTNNFSSFSFLDLHRRSGECFRVLIFLFNTDYLKWYLTTKYQFSPNWDNICLLVKPTVDTGWSCSA